MLLAFAAAIVVANRGDHFKERNDTYIYKEHYRCMLSSGKSCNDIVRGMDVLFYTIAKVIALLSFNDFFIYKLILALLILFPILLFVVTYSVNPLISILFLLVDYRFYEYSANVLRHGLALAFFCLFAVFYKHHMNKIKIASIFAILTHISAIIFLFFTSRRIKIKMGTFLSFLFVLWFFLSKSFINIFSQYLPSKIQFYLLATKIVHFDIPVHYLIVVALIILLYKRIEQAQLFIANSILILLLASLYLDLIGMGYRYVSFALPFVSVIIPHLIVIISRYFVLDKIVLRLIAYAGTFIILTGLFFKYIPFYIIHLGT